MSQSVEIISSILNCLPDQSQNASRLLFTSMVTIAKGKWLIFMFLTHGTNHFYFSILFLDCKSVMVEFDTVGYLLLESYTVRTGYKIGQKQVVFRKMSPYLIIKTILFRNFTGYQIDFFVENGFSRCYLIASKLLDYENFWKSGNFR